MFFIAHYLQGLNQVLMFSFREIIFPGVSPCSNPPPALTFPGPLNLDLQKKISLAASNTNINIKSSDDFYIVFDPWWIF